MLELIRFILDSAGSLIPFRVVWEWEMGLLFLFGKYQRTLGPGLKLVCPGVTEVQKVAVVPEIHTTPLQTISLRDDRILTYSASITVVVVDPERAFTKVGHYAETVVELAGRVVSSELADAKPERLDPERGKRANLIEEIRKEVDDKARAYGCSVTALGLNNFAMNVPTVRLLLDKAVIGDKTVPIG